MHKITIKIAAVVIATSFLAACGGNQEEVVTEEEVIIEEAAVEDDTEEITYVLPSPLQIAELFKSSGLDYIGDLTNSVDKVDNYNSKYDQKLNYGVYASNMAYCIMNNQTQESINYLAALKKLSEKLWMTDVMGSMGLSKRLEANIGNEDSLVYIMADLQMQMDDYLEENGMGYTGSIIFAGAWIETMYLGAKVNEAKVNPKLISRISEQAIILDILIKSIKQNDDDNEFSELLTDLETINSHFTGFDGDSDEEFILSDEAVASLSADLTTIRTKIVGE